MPDMRVDARPAALDSHGPSFTLGWNNAGGGKGCTVLEGGRCFRSPNFGAGKYPANARCGIRVSRDVRLDVKTFELDGGSYDDMTINGKKYGGAAPLPALIEVKKGTYITWTSHAEQYRYVYEFPRGRVKRRVPGSGEARFEICSYGESKASAESVGLQIKDLEVSEAANPASFLELGSATKQFCDASLGNFGKWTRNRIPTALSFWFCILPHSHSHNGCILFPSLQIASFRVLSTKFAWEMNTVSLGTATT